VANSDSFRQIVVFPEIYVLFKILLCSLCELPKESKTVNGVLPLGPKMANSEVGPLGRGFGKARLVNGCRTFLFFWCLQSGYSATLLRVNRCRSPSIWQQMATNYIRDYQL